MPWSELGRLLRGDAGESLFPSMSLDTRSSISDLRASADLPGEGAFRLLAMLRSALSRFLPRQCSAAMRHIAPPAMPFVVSTLPGGLFWPGAHP